MKPPVGPAAKPPAPGVKPLESKPPSAAKPAGSPPAGGPVSPSGGPKIQRNIMTDVPPTGQVPGTKKEDKEVPTVSDLLSFDEKDKGKKVDLPGKDVKVPPELLKKEGPPAPLPDPGTKKEPPPPPAGGSMKVTPAPAPPGGAPPKAPDKSIPDELPPLPELEDDKGTDII